MQIFQFIKYNRETTVEHLLKNSRSGAFLCFDFEDGVQYPLDLSTKGQLKDDARACFRRLLFAIKKIREPLKIGVRLNFGNPVEFRKDIRALECLQVDVLFMPKADNPVRLKEAIGMANSAHVGFKEIIPIIESPLGIENLSEILKVSACRHIAFGHCDYNRGLKIFPFFHQDTLEYWKWVDKILSIVRRFQVTFVNSPYLDMGNDLFFEAMLSHLYRITNGVFGQITFSNRQSRLCAGYDKSHENFKDIIRNRMDLFVSEQYAQKLISNFESNLGERGFSQKGKVIISYQEYKSAKQYLQSGKKKTIKMVIVGGCFPVQDDLLFENHFHQILKKKIEVNGDFELQIHIIRYERFGSVLEKIKKQSKERSFNVLIFSIRAEPYLRLVKFYYKHLDDKGKIRHSINLPLLKVLPPEKYNQQILSRYGEYRPAAVKMFFHGYLVDANYLLGKLIGNQKNALTKYLTLLQKVQTYCELNQINFIPLGPALRAKTSIEPVLVRKQEYFLRKHLNNKNYISAPGTLFTGGDVFLRENGGNVNEQFHKIIAEHLFVKFKRMFPG